MMPTREARFRRRTHAAIIALMVVVGCWLAWSLQQQLHDSQLIEQQFTAAINGSAQGLWSWNVPADQADWNASEFWAGPNLQRMIGHGDKPICTYGEFMECVYPDDRAAVQQAVLLAVRTTASLDIEFQLLDGDGNYRWVHSRGQLSRIDGKLSLSGSTIDISSRKIERLRADMIVNSASVAIIMCGPQRLVTVYNDRAEEMFGWPAEDMVGNSIDRLVSDDYLIKHRVVFEHAVTAMQQQPDNTYVRRIGIQGMAKRADGTLFPISLDVKALKYRGKIEFIATIRDLSQQPLEPAASGILNTQGAEKK